MSRVAARRQAGAPDRGRTRISLLAMGGGWTLLLATAAVIRQMRMRLGFAPVQVDNNARGYFGATCKHGKKRLQVTRRRQAGRARTLSQLLLGYGKL